MKVQSLDYVILVVDDLASSLAFYRGVLGIPLKHRAERFAQLETGNTRLGLFTREAMARTLGEPLIKPRRGAESFEIGFKVEDVDAAYDEAIAAGATAQTPPHNQPWGQRTAYLRDPDDNLVELVQDHRG